MGFKNILRKVVNIEGILSVALVVGFIGWGYSVYRVDKKESDNLRAQIIETLDTDHNGILSKNEKVRFCDEIGIKYDESGPIPSPRLTNEQVFNYLRKHGVEPKYFPVKTPFG
ncbi:MAG: hypothetical protein KJ721_01605 [Nanoarchaeota archaeon]|nr:hypothetical protein [Nanoarchaeota archaeon]